MPPSHRALLRGLTLLLLIVFTLPAFALQPVNRQVRVLLDVTGALTVGATGAHSGVVDGAQRFRTAFDLDWPVTARDGQLYVDDNRIGTRLLLEPDGSFMRVNGNRYRGSIQLTAQGDQVQVINVVDMESYLRGVVPSEMSASWPMEALKAQAVAARSYTITSLKPGSDYDLCATVECQVYRGVEVEHPRTDSAVATTAGVVVTYGGATAQTYYHADSGGMIASSQEVWGSALPYLIARADAATSTPHRSWVVTLDAAALSASMDSAGLGVGTVTGLRVLRLSESGRVLELQVTGSHGSQTVNGSQLTSMTRSWGLKSTRFSVQGALTVRGDGWGHGVGMSQYGARALAQAGYDYGRILAFFYPSTSITQFVVEGR